MTLNDLVDKVLLRTSKIEENEIEIENIAEHEQIVPLTEEIDEFLENIDSLTRQLLNKNTIEGIKPVLRASIETNRQNLEEKRNERQRTLEEIITNLNFEISKFRQEITTLSQSAAQVIRKIGEVEKEKAEREAAKEERAEEA